MNNRSNKPQQPDLIPKNKRAVIILSIVTVCLVLGFLSIRPSVEPTPEPLSQVQIIESLRTKIDHLADKLLTDFPNDPRLIKTAVRYNRQCNNSLKAMAILEKTLKSNPANFEFCNMVAKIAINNAMHEKAIIYAKKALAIKPDKLKLHENIATALIALGRYKDAINQLHRNINAENASPKTHYLLGQAHLQLNDFDNAKSAFEKTLTLDPSHHQANYGLAKVYLRTRHRENAKKYMDLYNKYKSSKVDEMQGWAGNSDNLVTDKSIENIKSFMTIFSNLSLRGNELYKSVNALKNAEQITENCEETYKQIVNYLPNQPDLYHNFALFYINTRKMPKKAVPLAQKAGELDASAKNYYMLARAYFHILNKMEAQTAIKKAVELDNNNSEYKRLHFLIERMK